MVLTKIEFDNNTGDTVIVTLEVVDSDNLWMPEDSVSPIQRFKKTTNIGELSGHSIAIPTGNTKPSWNHIGWPKWEPDDDNYGYAIRYNLCRR